jgi:hypothetical protein
MGGVVPVTLWAEWGVGDGDARRFVTGGGLGIAEADGVALLPGWDPRRSGTDEDRRVRPNDMTMDVQPITYRGRIVAACTGSAFCSPTT